MGVLDKVSLRACIAWWWWWWWCSCCCFALMCMCTSMYVTVLLVVCVLFFEKVGDSTVLYSADPKQLCELNFTLSQF